MSAPTPGGTARRAQRRLRRPLALAALVCGSVLVTACSTGSADPTAADRIAPAAAAQDLGTPAVADGHAGHANHAVALRKPKDDPEKGLIHDGLTPATSGPCLGLYEVRQDASGVPMCSHGPDAPPKPGLEVDKPVEPLAPAMRMRVSGKRDDLPSEKELARAAARAQAEVATLAVPVAGAAATAAGQVVCDGDGTAGNRVHVLYVHGSRDRFAQVADTIRTVAAGVDEIYSKSAQKTGGDRRVRYVTEVSGGACRPVVTSVAVNDSQMSDFSTQIRAVKALGFNRADRKYLMFAEATTYCGIGEFPGDDRKIASNRSNFGPNYSRVDSGCWDAISAAHELGHNLGAVSNSAPNSSKGGHCVDEYDTMCYRDAPNYPQMKILCPDRANDSRLDCGNDDYYHTNPPAGSYLATKYNVADNVFLIKGNPAPNPNPNPTPTPTATTPNPTPTPTPTPTSTSTSTPTPTPTQGDGTPVAGRTYTIANGLIGWVADGGAGVTAPGTPVVGRTAQGGSSEKWTVVAGTGSAFALKNVNSGLCLEILGTTAGGRAVQATCVAGQATQQWTTTRGPRSGSVQLINAATKLALGIGGESFASARVLAQVQPSSWMSSRSWVFRAA